MNEDPSVTEWRDIMSKHRYTYPSTDAGDVPAGTKFEHAFIDREFKSHKGDLVNLPPHYRILPVECIDVTEHFNFCLGNAIKYIWRADHKGKPVEDLKKAAWYINREIERRERE
jgi:hypothetical protein